MPEQGRDRHIEYIRSDDEDALAIELADRLWQSFGDKMMEPILADKSREVRRIRPELRAELVYYGLVCGLREVVTGVREGTISFILLKPRNGMEDDG